jgi:hypothetical protein
MIFENIFCNYQDIAYTEMDLKQQGDHRYIKYISDFNIHWTIYVVSKYLT